jgi:hypothetical protein
MVLAATRLRQQAAPERVRPRRKTWLLLRLLLARLAINPASPVRLDLRQVKLGQLLARVPLTRVLLDRALLDRALLDRMPPETQQIKVQLELARHKAAICRRLALNCPYSRSSA